jgi:sterol desaturase/sphingolipid hydroxylase (fatty acid hydroxylase superfamily)
VTYWHWLAGISLFFALAERLRPARPAQPLLRGQWANDLFYLAFNGHFYALLAGGIAGALALRTRAALSPWLPFAGPGEGLAAWPAWAQFAVYLLASDFLQWGVHNLLHRVPFLWQFHKVHHSIHTMDWAGNFRFHWIELVVYRALLYVPLSLLGGDGGPLFAVAVFATFWGHLNHANLDVDLGRLGYLFNSPRMHLWHHDASDEGGVAKNFGIVLSLWDWLFGTAWWPRERTPGRIGYPGDAELPPDLPRQMLFPLTRLRGGAGQAGPP